MKKILFINSNKAWGGGEKWHHNMSLAISNSETKYEVSLLANHESELHYKLKQNKKIKTYSLNLSNISYLNPLKRFKAKQLLRRLKPDVIILNLPSDVKLFAPIAKKIGVEKVIYRRGMPHPIKKNYLNNLTYKNVDLFIANSIEIKKSIIQNYPEFESKVKIIYNGVDFRELTLKEVSSPIILGNLGRLVHQKGQIQLINLAKKLIEKSFNHFVIKIAGKGPLEEELNELIRKNELSEHIKMLGHIDTDSFFRKIDLFIFTSYFEGSANALIESLQYSIPAITFNISSNPEVIQDGENGYLVSVDDTEQMANKIIELSGDPKRYHKMQEACHKILTQKFIYSDKIKEFEEIINES